MLSGAQEISASTRVASMMRTGTVCVMPSIDPVTVAVPAATPVITPASLMVAIEGAELDQLTAGQSRLTTRVLPEASTSRYWQLPATGAQVEVWLTSSGSGVGAQETLKLSSSGKGRSGLRAPPPPPQAVSTRAASSSTARGWKKRTLSLMRGIPKLKFRLLTYTDAYDRPRRRPSRRKFKIIKQ